MESLLTGIALAAAALGGLAYMWNKVVRPAAKFVSEWPEAYRVLLEISDEFKPNAGHSLSDRVQSLENGQTSMGLQIDNITRQIETYLVGRAPEGEH